MNCRRVEHLLQDEIEDLTSERDTQAIEAHLASCPNCRLLQEQFLTMRTELQELAERRPVVETQIDQRAIERWLGEREASGGSGQRRLPRWFLVRQGSLRPSPRPV